MAAVDTTLIWGAGAIGGTIGAFLARAGNDVVLVDSLGEHVAAMGSRGITITGPVAAFTTPVTAMTPEQVEGSYRRVLLCVKGQDTARAARMLAPHLADDGHVVSLQNGLNEEAIADVVGAARTVGAFINFGADYHGPGEILYGGRSAVVVGEMDGTMTPRLESLAALLQQFEPAAVATSNIQGYLWSKLAYCSLLWANALVAAELSEVFASRRYRAMLTELTREVVRIAERHGTRLEPFDPFDPAGFTRDATDEDTERVFATLHAQRLTSAKKHSGMWRDIAVRRRRTEADSLLVPVLDAAATADVAVPLNRRMLELLRELESGRRRQGWENFDALVQLMV